MSSADAPTEDDTSAENDAADGAVPADDAPTQDAETAEKPTLDIGVDAADLAEVPLRVEGLEKRFGGITAVDGASFEVERGTLTGLIGPNGAGKSTTFNLVTGFNEPDSGSVYFDDEDVTGDAPHALAQQGLVRTFQIARELDDMTVMENMMLAPKGQSGEQLWRSVLPGTRGRVREQETANLDRTWRTLEFFELDHLWDEYAGNLSGGQRKLLEMARVLMTDPQVVLLDEPLAGVNPSLEKRLLEHLHELADRGYTFLIVEHDMDVIMEHCERVIVMHQGQVLAEGTPDEIRDNERVIEAYLGEDV